MPLESIGTTTEIEAAQWQARIDLAAAHRPALLARRPLQSPAAEVGSVAVLGAALTGSS